MSKPRRRKRRKKRAAPTTSVLINFGERKGEIVEIPLTPSMIAIRNRFRQLKQRAANG